MEKFSVSLPLTGEYLTTVRLTTGGLCALSGFDVDSTEDYKVCVTESLLILKRNGFKRAQICFEVGEMLACVVRGENRDETQEVDSLEEEISSIQGCYSRLVFFLPSPASLKPSCHRSFSNNIHSKTSIISIRQRRSIHLSR